jgi:hypothetical protein
MMRQPPKTSEEIQDFPNIIELIGALNELESLVFQQEGEWEDTLHHIPSWIDDPYIDFINDADDDAFVFKRLDSKRYSLKPNLSSHRFIFRGQNKPYDKIQSSFERKTLDEKLISNLKYADFKFLLQSHPLFMLFDRGIYLPPRKKPVFIEMNYWGLSQHYGFNTGLLDFTTDISVAAFFATTKYLGDDTYEPITDTTAYPFGVIYVHQLQPEISFKTCFRSIGLQVFPRTAKQKGLFFQEDSPFRCEDVVAAFYFRHDPDLSLRIYNEMEKGAMLFPKDMLAPYAQDILKSNTISGQAFAYNLYVNPRDDMQTNLCRVRDKDHDIDFHKAWMFTEEMLEPYYKEIRHGLWESFCNQVYFAGDEEGHIKESLLAIPNRPEYAQYFNQRGFARLQYHAIDNWRKAHRRV